MERLINTFTKYRSLKQNYGLPSEVSAGYTDTILFVCMQCVWMCKCFYNVYTNEESLFKK